MTFTYIFEELNTIYTEAWFQDAEEKFKNHPSNKNQESSFEITYIINEEAGERATKLISIEDFIMGLRDDAYDDIHDEKENDKLVTVGILPNGYSKQILPEGEVYNSSSNFYPYPALDIWQKKVTSKIDKSLSLITTLAEKELLLNSIASIIKEYKELSTGTALRSTILLKILRVINAYIANLVEEISELNTFVEDYNMKDRLLNFNIDQANLAKLIKLLIDKKIIDESHTTKNELLKWFSRNSMVKSNTSKKILPKSLDAEFRRLSTKQNLDLNSWFNNL